MQDATDYPTIIHPFLAAYVGGQKRLDLLPLVVAQPKQIASHLPNPTILFVEDDDGVRASTEAILRNAWFRLLVARDGDEALRLLANHEVDVPFTDIVMPDLNGVELAKRAKLLRPNLKIMFVTGYYSRAAEAVMLKVGKLTFKPLREAPIVRGLTDLVLKPTAT